jgi:ketosteroid isomerase-like protein
MIGAIIAKRMARSAFDSLNRRDFASFLAGYSGDATYTYPGTLSVSGTHTGKEAIEAWWAKWVEQFPEARFTVKNVCVRDIFALTGSNVLAIEWDMEYTNRQGVSGANSGVTVVQARNGKTVSVQLYVLDAESQKKGWGEEEGSQSD